MTCLLAPAVSLGKFQTAKIARNYTNALLFYLSSHFRFLPFHLIHPPVLTNDYSRSKVPQKSAWYSQQRELFPATRWRLQFQNHSLELSKTPVNPGSVSNSCDTPSFPEVFTDERPWVLMKPKTLSRARARESTKGETQPGYSTLPVMCKPQKSHTSSEQPCPSYSQVTCLVDHEERNFWN